ncbi:MAG: hypothetical protein JSV80_00525 [Acidobacteriota bacterium]|nr:MAG: hypothetical protein JSV80_00525 [Acidobacteriota bacterium]
MKQRILIAVLTAGVAGSAGLAQSQQVAAPSGQKTLAATMNVYVFPKAGQKAEQQSQHEAECYSWAVQNTGTDPFELTKKAEQQQQQAQQAKKQAQSAGQGAGAAGAVKGAAVGALIGEIASDDAGEGAAYGAAAGLISGRRRARAARRQAEEQAEQQAQKSQQWTAEQLVNFKKAFSVCLEAKDYLVKY